VNIIIGNNSVILRNMLRDILIEAGNDVVCLTANGQEIVETAKSCSIDLVILGEDLSHVSEMDITNILNNEAPVATILMGKKSNLWPVKPQKIIPKPEIDRMTRIIMRL